MAAIDIAPNTSPNLVYEMPYETVIEDRPSTAPVSCKGIDDYFLSHKKKCTEPVRAAKGFTIIIDGQPLVINLDTKSESEMASNETSVQDETFIEKLSDIKTRLALSITQIAELFGVTRKTIYDWNEGTMPRQGITIRMDLLIDALTSVPLEQDLQRLKTIWNIPVSGNSFLAIFNDEISDSLFFRTTLESKLHELSPRMAKKTSSKLKTKVQLGEAHLTEYNKHTTST